MGIKPIQRQQSWGAVNQPGPERKVYSSWPNPRIEPGDICSLATLPFELLCSIVREGLLDIEDMASLRAVSRGWWETFTSESWNKFILRHFFPLSLETYVQHRQPGDDPKYEREYPGLDVNLPSDIPRNRNAFGAVRRLARQKHALRTGCWSGGTSWQLEFPPLTNEPWFAGRVLLDCDFGLMATMTTDLEQGRFIIACSNLLTSTTITIAVKLDIFPEDPENPGKYLMPNNRPGVYLSGGKLLVIHTNNEGDSSSIALIDGTFDGRCLWNAKINLTTIYQPPDPEEGDRFAPVFNDHYVLFLNKYEPNHPDSDSGQLCLIRFTYPDIDAYYVGRAVTKDLLSFKADYRGEVAMIALQTASEWETDNKHHVYIADAFSGVTNTFYTMAMPDSCLGGNRDIDYAMSYDGRTLMLYGSSYNDMYRNSFVGHISTFPIFRPTADLDEAEAKMANTRRGIHTRFLALKDDIPTRPGDAQMAGTGFNFDLNCAAYVRTPRHGEDPAKFVPEPKWFGFGSLNLDVPAADVYFKGNMHRQPEVQWESTILDVRAYGQIKGLAKPDHVVGSLVSLDWGREWMCVTLEPHEQPNIPAGGETPKNKLKVLRAYYIGGAFDNLSRATVAELLNKTTATPISEVTDKTRKYAAAEQERKELEELGRKTKKQMEKSEAEEALKKLGGLSLDAKGEKEQKRRSWRGLFGGKKE